MSEKLHGSSTLESKALKRRHNKKVTKKRNIIASQRSESSSQCIMQYLSTHTAWISTKI